MVYILSRCLAAKDPIVATLFNMVAAHWPVMVRPNVNSQDSLEDPDEVNGHDPEEVDDADLAQGLGVLSGVAEPVEPLPDSQIPETQLLESQVYVDPDMHFDSQVPANDCPVVPCDGQDSLENVSEGGVNLDGKDSAASPATEKSDSVAPTEIESTPSPPRPGPDGLIKISDSPSIPVRVLPPENPAKVSEEDLATLRKKIALIK